MKYNVEELSKYAEEHTTNECAQHFGITYQAMAQLLYRYKLRHKVEQVNNYQRNTRLHWVWRAIKQRCENPRNKRYLSYGGRGITMCDDWKGVYGFLNFCKWSQENGYNEGLSLDRIDNDREYSPENCRWVKTETQANNKRTNVLVTYKGVTLTLKQWSDKLEIPYTTLQSRHYKGYSDIEIIEGKTTLSGRRNI